MCGMSDSSYSPKNKKEGNRSFHQRRFLLLTAAFLTAALLVWSLAAAPPQIHLPPKGTLRRFGGNSGTAIRHRPGGATIHSGRKTEQQSAVSTLPRLIDPSSGHELSLDEKTTRFRGKRLALYFAAGWCPMCRRFEGPLMEFLQENESANNKIQLIYVPSDSDGESAVERAAKFNMPMVPFDSSDVDALKRHHHVWSGREKPKFGTNGRRAGVPSIVVLDSQTGDELQFLPTEREGAQALQSWKLLGNEEEESSRAIW